MTANESPNLNSYVTFEFDGLNQSKEDVITIKGFPTERVTAKLLFCTESYCTLDLRFENNLHIMSKSYYYQIKIKILISKIIKESAIETEETLFGCNKFREDKSMVFKKLLEWELWDSLNKFLSAAPFKATVDITRICADTVIDQGVLSYPTIDWFKDMFMDDSGDIKIEVESTIFTAHRFILSARSDVFKAMLNNEMKEKEANEIKMQYFEADVFKKFLWYLYTGEINDLDTLSVLELYKIADMYQVETLKKQCMEFIKFNVTIDSTFSFLEFSDLFQVKDLKENLLKFVNMNEKMFAERDDFKKYLTDNLSTNTIADVLKMIDKHEPHLDDIKLPVFEFIKTNNADIVKNEKFLNLFGAYGSLMREIYVFIHTNA